MALRYLFYVLLISNMAQASAAGSPFAAFLGEWKGRCELSPTFNGVESFEASVKIAKTQKSDRLQWRIVYEASGSMPRQVRAYELVTVNETEGHYVVDEHNGLLLDSYFDGKGLFSSFTINGQLITSSFAVNGEDQMLVNLPSYSTAPVRTTSLTDNPSVVVQSLGRRLIQSCVLKKI